MSTLEYIIHHVFMPPKLPQKDDYTAVNEERLCRTIHRAAVNYAKHAVLTTPEEKHVWKHLVKMLDNIAEWQSPRGMSIDLIEKGLLDMQDDGATLAYLIRAQNAGIIFQKTSTQIVVSSFEVSPTAKSVMEAQGKLSCSYPGPAIAVPIHHFRQPTFVHELASFLAQMNLDGLDSMATTQKASSTVVEERETPSPRYITTLLTGILRGIGSPADIVRIRKRINDDVLWKDARLPWRRSKIWLVLRVAMQLHLLDTLHYKPFMLFMMCEILSEAVKEGFDSEFIHSMNLKIGVRVSKLGPSISKSLLKGITRATGKAKRLLENRWKTVIANESKPYSWDPEAILASREKDCILSLPNSRDYIFGVLNRPTPIISSHTYTPEVQPRTLREIQDFTQCSKEVMRKAFLDDLRTALADLEASIQGNLRDWVAEHMDDTSAPSILLTILEEYLAAGKGFYRFPEDNSIMILTLFEIWVAIDTIVTSIYPLLASYSPEIPPGIFEPLLLRKSADITRLVDIHRYFSFRHQKAKLGTVFEDISQCRPDSFAVKFFDQSSELQALKTRVEDNAQQTREQRRKEYLQKRQQYKDKTRQALNEPPCPQANAGNHRNCPHSKCVLEREAKRLKIEVHEWPLPRDANAAKATIFELHCPVAFGVWRDATCIILKDVCQVRISDDDVKANPVIVFDKSITLERWRPEMGTRHRITLGSATKSFLNSHYKSIKISKANSEDNVLVENGLSFQLYDETMNVWVADSFQNLTITPWCRPRLSATSAYLPLQASIESTNYDSNLVIANQSLCSDRLGFHEFVSFGTVRVGQNLQWLNVAKEIRSRHGKLEQFLIQGIWNGIGTYVNRVLATHCSPS
ncbi:hypothetical protein VKT23_019755 [Stygiomarasmius scandens]|uniref:DUF6606 domain-containing protein n=1 Tax=Marasmiellus scandens TaxID=2682957 RepID=A0ABR1IMR6_9AGAR